MPAAVLASGGPGSRSGSTPHHNRCAMLTCWAACLPATCNSSTSMQTHGHCQIHSSYYMMKSQTHLSFYIIKKSVVCVPLQVRLWEAAGSTVTVCALCALPQCWSPASICSAGAVQHRISAANLAANISKQLTSMGLRSAILAAASYDSTSTRNRAVTLGLAYRQS